MTPEQHEDLAIQILSSLARAVVDGRKQRHLVPVVASSSSVNGRLDEGDEFFTGLIWDDRVFADPGPSPAGNAGPYLHVPHANGGVHRVYPHPRIWSGNRFTWFDSHGFYGLKPETARLVHKVPIGEVREVALTIDRVQLVRIADVTEEDARAELYPQIPAIILDETSDAVKRATAGRGPLMANFIGSYAILHGEQALSRWAWAVTFSRGLGRSRWRGPSSSRIT